MKKQYQKPVFAVEEFALTQQISACAYLKIGFNTSACVTDNKDQSDKLVPGYGELYGLAKIGYFWAPAPNGCEINGSFATESDLLCYHTLANMAFTS